MTELIYEIDKTFNFENKLLRVIGTYGEPWFVAKDICDILGLSNITEALRNIPEKWRTSEIMKCANGQNMNMIIIKEPALYKLIMRSTKPVAQVFQEAVCEEILPSIRKTGEFKLKELLDQKNQEIEKIKEEKNQIKSEYQSLRKDHAQIIKRRHDHKFKKGKCFYICWDPRLPNYNKPGSSIDVEEFRLDSYRTISPDIQIIFLVYLEENLFLEQVILHKFRDRLTHLNHEIMYNVSLEEYIKEIEHVIEEFGFQATYEYHHF